MKKFKGRRLTAKLSVKKTQSKKYKRMCILFPSRRNSHKMVAGVGGREGRSAEKGVLGCWRPLCQTESGRALPN